MSKKVFIGMSSSNSIPQIYFKEAASVVSICVDSKYDLVFGAYNEGLMGVVYKEYLRNPERKIYAICDKIYEKSLIDLHADETIITNNAVEQIEYFMKCDKLIFLPGGYGTLTELLYLITAKVNKKHNKEIIIVNKNHFYDNVLKHFNKMYKEGFVKDIKCFIEIQSIEELKQYL